MFGQGKKNLHKKRIIREIKKKTAEKFQVGDLVRVKMGALFFKIRKLIKSVNEKLIVVNFFPDVCTMLSILNKDLTDSQDHLRRALSVVINLNEIFVILGSSLSMGSNYPMCRSS